ncbi:MAG: methionine--tRNA ligase [Endomicrobia bacterium]|nr:methionine--tRNA ligase [Endomicrobiia bacterium]
MKKFYLTTPIYYVNDEPHIGHTYTTILADVLARYYKLLGYDTFFLTGTDEHGAKIYEAALKNNMDPKSFCDTIVDKFKSAWQSLEINYSRFIRTTDEHHEKTVQLILKKIYEQGDIYKANYEGLYCIQCERYIPDDELVDGLCPDHNIKPILQREENYFFKLSKYKEVVYNKVLSGELEIFPETRRNEILGKLQLKLEDISISRKHLKWGIPVPFDQQQTVYVWIDALVNYLSGIDFFNISLETLDMKHFWPCDLHIIGKDILWFHAVIWPAMLLSAGVELPRKILAHGFFTVEGKKMSKTLGNVIRPKELLEIFGVDATRLLVLSSFPVGSDGNFSIIESKEKYNKELADNFGNLVSRTFAMLSKYFNNEIVPTECSSEMKHTIYEAVNSYKSFFAELSLDKIPDAIFSLTSYANKYVQMKSPWIVAKEKRKDELISILSDLLYCIKASALLFYPIMPNVTKKIVESFNETEYTEFDYKKLLEEKTITIRNHKFKPVDILFKKLK